MTNVIFAVDYVTAIKRSLVSPRSKKRLMRHKPSVHMTSSGLPSLSLGFEFEGWLVTCYDDVEGSFDNRELPKTGTQKGAAEICDEEDYNQKNPVPARWNPNKNRIPSVERGDELLLQLRKTTKEALDGFGLPGAELVSHASEEHPDSHDKYSIVRERGTERNFEALTDPSKKEDLKRNLSRLDSQVFVGQYYFLGFELRPRVYKGVKEGGAYSKIWDELRSVVGALRERHALSVNAGNDVYFKLPPEIHGENRVQLGEARSGLHIHVGAEGVFSHLEPDLRTKDSIRYSTLMNRRILAVKKLLTLYWLVEPKLTGLHARWRSEDPRYSGLLRRHSNLAFYPSVREKAKTEREQPVQHYFQKEDDDKNSGSSFYSLEDFDSESQKGPNDEGSSKFAERLHKVLGKGRRVTDHDKAAITTIWKTASMDQLVWLASSYFGNRRAALSLHQLMAPDSRFRGGGVRDAPEKRLGTVEYRLMQGSFDVDAVEAWTDVVLRMTEVCVPGGPVVDFVQFIDGVVATPGQEEEEEGKQQANRAFIKRLGLGEESRAYKFYSDDQRKLLEEEADPRRNIFVTSTTKIILNGQSS